MSYHTLKCFLIVKRLPRKPIPTPSTSATGTRVEKISCVETNDIMLPIKLNLSAIYAQILPYRTARSPRGMAAPIRPIRIPSTTNGDLTRKSVAPMSFMIAISSFLTAIPVVTVLLIRNIATHKRMRMIPPET